MVRRATNAEAGAVARPSAFALFMQDMKVQGLSPRQISQDGRCRLTKKTPLKGMEHYRLRWHLTLSNPVNLVDCCTCQSFFAQLLLTIYQMTPQAFALQTAIFFVVPWLRVSFLACASTRLSSTDCTINQGRWGQIWGKCTGRRRTKGMLLIGTRKESAKQAGGLCKNPHWTRWTRTRRTWCNGWTVCRSLCRSQLSQAHCWGVAPMDRSIFAIGWAQSLLWRCLTVHWMRKRRTNLLRRTALCQRPFGWQT